jgi:hypothetical protein
MRRKNPVTTLLVCWALIQVFKIKMWLIGWVVRKPRLRTDVLITIQYRRVVVDILRRLKRFNVLETEAIKIYSLWVMRIAVIKHRKSNANS